MAQVFGVNGTTINYVVNAQWIERPEDDYLNGQTVRNRWRTHTWQTEVMSASEFNTLYALEGQQVTITTVDYEDRTGNYKTYYGAELRSIGGDHDGPNFQNILIEFLVKV